MESKAKAPLRVLVPVANGSEEIEATCIIDTLRRAGSALAVTVASVESSTNVVMSRQTKLQADMLLDEAAKLAPFDMVACPGGMPGAERLRDSQLLTSLLKEQAKAGRLYAAVCASPAVVLHSHGLLDGHAATCHPGFQSKLTDCKKDRVVVSNGQCITSQGPGTSLEFALQLVASLLGKEAADAVAKPMVLHFAAGETTAFFGSKGKAGKAEAKL